MPIERFWVEVNKRVNYPIKVALVIIDNNGQIDMENESHKFSVSFIVMAIAKYGLNVVVNSWNEHSIPGRLMLHF